MGVVEAKIQTVEDIYGLVWAAVANKQPMRAIYKDLPRLFCPHRLGRNQAGQRRVLCYQYGGGLCCKNNSVGETEPTANLIVQLFRFQSEDFTDELNLPKHIPFRQPLHLPFPDHVQNLVALNRPPGAIERSKTLAGIHPPLNRSMVLFHNIV